MPISIINNYSQVINRKRLEMRNTVFNPTDLKNGRISFTKTAITFFLLHVGNCYKTLSLTHRYYAPFYQYAMLLINVTFCVIFAIRYL